ncbi:MAG: SapC family protein [Aliiglaciecola sp.]
MTQFAILDPKKHGQLRVSTQRGAQYGECINHVPIVADELENLSLEYPVGFLKDHETGQFGMHAITGFQPNENLFLNGNNWDATAIPLHILRQPFVVANSDSGDEPTAASETLLCIDLDSPRVVTEGGQCLFDNNLQATEFLNRMSSMLATIMAGREKTEYFIQALLQQNLLEPVRLSVTDKSGPSQYFDGLYAVNKAKVDSLSDETVLKFYKSGYLKALYLVTAASGNFHKLNIRRQQKFSKGNV